MARFYNPGFRWNDVLKFDNPVNDAASSNISYYRVDAPEKGFFEVKDTQTVNLDGGEEFEVPLRFKELIRMQYAERGVILIAPGKKDIPETINIAANDDDARAKGDAIWKAYEHDKANEWMAIVHQTKASGMIPKAATGLFKRVLDDLHIQDPADTASGLTAAREGQAENKDLQAQIAALTATVNQLVGAAGKVAKH